MLLSGTPQVSSLLPAVKPETPPVLKVSLINPHVSKKWCEWELIAEDTTGVWPTIRVGVKWPVDIAKDKMMALVKEVIAGNIGHEKAVVDSVKSLRVDRPKLGSVTETAAVSGKGEV